MTLILASASPRRLELLKQLGVEPDKVIHPEIEETPLKGEQPLPYAQRMAREKALAIKEEGIVLAADTVVACGRRILPKADDEKAARQCLALLSGRRHRVYTSVAVRDAKGKISERTQMSVVQFKRLSQPEIDAYVASQEWQGKAGGYALQGKAAAFISWMSGSPSSVVGLPLFETAQLLQSLLGGPFPSPCKGEGKGEGQ